LAAAGRRICSGARFALSAGEPEEKDLEENAYTEEKDY